MLRFFRKVRQRLLLERKTGKYFRYAIGEILLVMIGILLALQVNNWNENRKSSEKSKLLLKQVHKELAFNINRANAIVKFYRGRDSLVHKILNKTVTYDDYKNQRWYHHILGAAQDVNVVHEAYENLIDNQDLVAIGQDSIILKLKKLYGTNKDELDTMDELVIKNVFEYLHKLKNEKSWFYDLYTNKKQTDEMIHYFLNDPIYLNRITFYSMTNLTQHMKSTLRFRNNALSVYKEIADYLHIKKDTSIVKDIHSYKHYIGTYVSNNNHFIYKIKQRQNDLILEWKHKTDDATFGEIIFHPDTKTLFTFRNTSFGELTYNNANEVTGFIGSKGKDRTLFKKIK